MFLTFGRFLEALNTLKKTVSAPPRDQKSLALRQSISRLAEAFKASKLELREIFREFDQNNDNVLSREEFLIGLDRYDRELQLNESDKLDLVCLADKNKDSRIDLEEFIALFEGQSIKEEDLS